MTRCSVLRTSPSRSRKWLLLRWVLPRVARERP